MAVKTFTTGEVLTAADTNTYLNNGGLVYITQTTLSGANVNIDNCFSSTYAAYRIVINGASCATGARFILFTFRPTSVSGYNTSYYFTQMENATASTTTNTTTFTTGLVVDAGAHSGGVIEVYNPQTAVTATFTASGTDPRTTGAYFRNAAGWHNQTGQYTGFTLTCQADSFDAGTATVYGYRLG